MGGEWKETFVVSHPNVFNPFPIDYVRTIEEDKAVSCVR